MLRSLSSHTLHLLTEAAVGILGFLILAGCFLAWRLSQGPLDITWLAQREQGRLTGGRASLTVGSAALVWEGFRNPDAPLDIRWRDATLRYRAGGATMASLPAGRVTLSAAALVFGRVVPQIVEVDGASVVLRRLLDGRVVLDVAAPRAGQNQPASKSQTGGTDLLRELTRPVTPDQASGFLSELQTVRVRDARITLQDAKAGLVWEAPAAAVDFERLAGGGVHGTARLAVVAGDVRATLTAEADLTADGTHLAARITPFSPAAVARAAPGLSALAAIEAATDLSLDAHLDAAFAPVSGQMTLHLGPGLIQTGKGAVRIAQASALVEGSPGKVVLKTLRVALAPVLGQTAGPVLSATADVARTGQHWRAGFALNLDQALFPDLAAYWPDGTGGGARPWILRNVTAGRAHDGHVTGTVEAADDLSDVTLTALAGGVAADDLTVWWLRPVPPIEHARARVVLDGPDMLRVLVDTGQQGALRIAGGTVAMRGLSMKDQFARINVTIDGKLPDVLALLNHKRLGLLARRPLDVTDPTGGVHADLTVDLPLDDRVIMDDVGIHARAKLADIHLGRVVAGRDLDHAQLDMAVDSDSLKITGDGQLATVPVRLAIDMDFRNGGPSQVLEHYNASGRATAAQLAAAGLPPGLLTAGTAGLVADYNQSRNGSGIVAVRGDFAGATLATPLGWNKPAGRPADLSGQIILDHGRLVGVDQLRATGAGLKIAAHADFGAKGRVLHLDQLQLGRTDLHGLIRFPSPGRVTDPLRISVAGPALDVSTYLAKSPSSDHAPSDSSDSQPPKRGSPWAMDAKIDRVILARDQAVTAVSVQAESDGWHITRATAQAGTGATLHASITPVPGGRKLVVDAPDSGAVLLAAGVADNIRSGHLTLDAKFDDAQPSSPLSGTATLASFRILDAPAIGRLLKAMTLYGAIDLMRGPGLGFARAVAPFRYQQRVLHLTNARAFSASLGLTAEGDIDLRRHLADITGTVVPAYFFNQLPGLLPIVGKLFSPEKGGGVFAARYSIRGNLTNPKVGVNPFSALAPGFLRGVFGLF